MTDDGEVPVPSPNNTLFGLNIDTGLLIAIFTAGCYYISYYYVNVYFSRLGIYSSQLSYSPDEIISKGIAMIFLSASLCSMVWAGLNLPDKSFKISWFLCNIPLFLIIGSILQQIRDPYFDIFAFNSIWAIGFVLFLIILLVYPLITKQILIKSVWENKYFGQRFDLISKILVILFILMSLAFVSIIYGENSARGDIECDGGSCSHMNFTFIDPNLSYINSPHLILITYHDGKYYLSNQEKPIPENPEIYIVSDNQISFINENC